MSTVTYNLTEAQSRALNALDEKEYRFPDKNLRAGSCKKLVEFGLAESELLHASTEWCCGQRTRTFKPAYRLTAIGAKLQGKPIGETP